MSFFDLRSSLLIDLPAIKCETTRHLLHPSATWNEGGGGGGGGGGGNFSQAVSFQIALLIGTQEANKPSILERAACVSMLPHAMSVMLVGYLELRLCQVAGNKLHVVPCLCW